MPNRFVLASRLTAALLICAGPGLATPEDSLKLRIQEAAKGFRDLTLTGAATYKDKKALAKVDQDFAQLYELKSAVISFKEPDKLRLDSKLGMVRVEYIVKSGRKTVRAKGPAINFNDTKDFSEEPAKINDAFDLGLVTPSMWRYRKMEVINDPGATAAGEIKLRLCWPTGNIVYLAWIDAANLWLKRIEKRSAADELFFRVVYSDPVKAGDVIWMPTKAELYTSDGEKAGTTEYRDLKVNTGLPDTLFD